MGINPIAWSNDDLPVVGGEIPLEQCLREGKEAGFEGFELGWKFSREPEGLKKQLAPFNLDLVSGWYSSNLAERSVEEELPYFKKHLNLLKSMGCRVIVFADTTGTVHGDPKTPLSKRPKLNESSWGPFCEKLNELASYSLSQGMQIAYHHHTGTLIQEPEEVDQLMDRCSNDVGLLLDTGHYTFMGGDPLEAVRKYGNRIYHLHCKDVRLQVAQDCLNKDMTFLKSVLRGVFTVPGDGCVPFLDIFKELKKRDYSGWIVVEAEQDHTVAPPRFYINKAGRFIKQTLKEAGF